MATIRTILPQKKEDDLPILRVAAYCRVSSDSDDQMHSFAAQTEYYTKLIGENPLWTLADIYADEGITGTSMKCRDEFNRMIADCKRGKIDRVLTKSVSRFARNTVDCLNTVRLLTGLGVSILFEKEQIDTSKMSSEVLLGMISTQAQDESSSISSNMLWSYEKRMKNGSFIGCNAPYGYRLKNGELIIQEEEAEIVRWIFREYLAGRGAGSIANELNERKLSTGNRSGVWRASTICIILRNERYMGDALLQKTIMTDAVPHMCVKNKGERTKYYVENSNPPIISREDFLAVQEGRKHNAAGDCTKPSKYAGLIKCAACGGPFSRSNGGYWACGQQLRSKSGCQPYRISEKELDIAIKRLIRTLCENGEILNHAIDLFEQVQDKETGIQDKIRSIDKDVAETSAQLLMLTQLQRQGILDAGDFADQNRSLAERISRLRAERRTILQGEENESLLKLIDLRDGIPETWEEVEKGDWSNLRTVIDRILVVDETTLVIHLQGGLTVTERLPLIKRRCQRHD